MTHIFDRDNGRYLFIIWTIFLIFLCLVFIILFRDSDFRFYENPWNRSDARILGAFAILGIIGLIFILLVSGFLLTLYTIFNYLRRNDVKFRKKRDYYITLGISCVLLILMVSSYIGTQIRTTTIQNTYIEFIQEEDIDLTPNINISDKNSPVQALGSYTFQYNVTYMYVIAVEDQPLPTKEFGFDLSFNNSNFNELLEWAMDLDRYFSRWDFRYSNIEIVMDSKNYYYIITSKRLFFDRQISNDSTINCNITCSVDQSELTPDIIDFQIKLVFLEDDSDTIIRGHRELIVIAYDADYALWLGIASILVILNSLVFILKYPDLDIS